MMLYLRLPLPLWDKAWDVFCSVGYPAHVAVRCHMGIVCPSRLSVLAAQTAPETLCTVVVLKQLCITPSCRGERNETRHGYCYHLQYGTEPKLLFLMLILMLLILILQLLMLILLLLLLILILLLLMLILLLLMLILLLLI